MSTVTMQELELETAELLPARETLWCYRSHSAPGFSQTNYGFGNANQVATGGSGDGNGILNFLNGDAVNINVL
jgi:hypothetical protein